VVVVVHLPLHFLTAIIVLFVFFYVIEQNVESQCLAAPITFRKEKKVASDLLIVLNNQNNPVR